jgi:hypothetical protein
MSFELTFTSVLRQPVQRSTFALRCAMIWSHVESAGRTATGGGPNGFHWRPATHPPSSVLAAAMTTQASRWAGRGILAILQRRILRLFTFSCE